MKHTVVIILLVLLTLNIKAQVRTADQGENSEIIYKLITENQTSIVKIVGVYESKSYDVDWLKNVQLVEGFLVFSKDDDRQEKHYWYVENVGFIQTYHTSDGFVVRIDIREKTTKL